MTHERFEPSLGEKKSGKPDPKRSRRGAAFLAAGLAFGSGAPKASEAAQPSSPPPTEQTEGSKKVAEGMKALRQSQEQDAAQIKEQKIRERLKTFRWVGGVGDPKLADPKNFFEHTLTSDYIEWMIKNGHAEHFLRFDPVTEAADFGHLAAGLSQTYLSETGHRGVVSKPMNIDDANRYLKFLKESGLAE